MFLLFEFLYITHNDVNTTDITKGMSWKLCLLERITCTFRHSFCQRHHYSLRQTFANAFFFKEKTFLCVCVCVWLFIWPQSGWTKVDRSLFID